jgi:hypothetical protein
VPHAKLEPLLAQLPGWRLIGRMRLRRNARLYQLEAPEGDAYAFKIFTSRREANAYYQALLAAHNRADAARGIAVPKPISLMPEQHAVVMEWVGAPRISDRLRWRPFGRCRQQALARAAQWLRWYHEGFPIHTASPNGNGEMLEHGVIHGDFTPSNLFVDATRVLGFDFTSQHTGLLLEDICRYLAYLSVYRLVPPSRADLKRWGCARADIELFARHYGHGLDKIPAEHYRPVQVAQLVRRLNTLNRLRNTLSGLHPLRYVERRRMRYLVRQATS